MLTVVRGYHLEVLDENMVELEEEKVSPISELMELSLNAFKALILLQL